MFNKFAKSLLVATSLAPILGAVAVNKLAHGGTWLVWLPWLLPAVSLGFICWLLLRFAAKTCQTEAVLIKEFENSDKEVLAFLLTYLLPFLASDKLDFTGEWLTGTYIFAIIFGVVFHADAFHFNPIMGLFGYHFYAVKTGDGVPYLLITKNSIRRPGIEVQAVKLAHNIYLHVKDSDAQ